MREVAVAATPEEDLSRKRIVKREGPELSQKYHMATEDGFIVVGPKSGAFHPLIQGSVAHDAPIIAA